MRAHSKFSASGAERWFNCPASVEASEGQPDRESPWAIEGTKAHGVLEILLRNAIGGKIETEIIAPIDMYNYAKKAAQFILTMGKKLDNAEILVEQRVYLDFIHPEMFGTLDSAILDHFATLHIFDFKYGAGHAVSPKENLQMIFYALAVAHKYNWNFSRVQLWIIQPRIRGYQGPTYWQMPIEMLKSYVKDFREAVWRVENAPEFKEGAWCHWCKAKSVCPLKTEGKLEKAKEIFSSQPIGGEHEVKKDKKVSAQSQKGQGAKASQKESPPERRLDKEKAKGRQSKKAQEDYEWGDSNGIEAADFFS